MPGYNTGIVESLFNGRSDSFSLFQRRNVTQNQAFWVQASQDIQCYAGSQSYWNQVYSSYPLLNNRLNFNIVRPMVNAIEGYQRLNRKNLIVEPRENGDEETAGQWTRLMFFLNRNQEISSILSDSFRGALTTGINFIYIWVDYRNDPINGDIRLERWAYNDCIIDGTFRNKDLSDCQGISRCSFFTPDVIKSLVPDKADLIDSLPLGVGEFAASFDYLHRLDEWQRNNTMPFVEYLYPAYRDKTMLTDITTGDHIEWKESEEELAEYLLDKPKIRVSKQKVPTVKLQIIVSNTVVYDGPNLLGVDRWPLIPVFAYFNPELDLMEERFMSVVRDCRDVQFFFNYRKGAELDILDSQTTSGIIFKEGSVINPDDLTKRGQGAMIGIKKNASMDDIRPIPAPDLPPGQFQESKSLEELAMKIMGINEAQLGSAVDDRAGVTERLRMGAGQTLLQPLFDQLDMSFQSLGDLLIEVVQNFWTPGKVKRIIEAEPTEQFYSRLFGRYNCVVSEGYDTSTQKQMQYAQYIQLKAAGVNIPDYMMIEAAQIQNKKQLREMIESQAMKQQEFEARQQELQLADMEAKTKLVMAQVSADTGLGDERRSRIRENEIMADERAAKTISELEKAHLDKIKAIKELESLDLDSLSKALTIAHAIKNMNFMESMPKHERMNDLKGQLGII